MGETTSWCYAGSARSSRVKLSFGNDPFDDEFHYSCTFTIREKIAPALTSLLLPKVRWCRLKTASFSLPVKIHITVSWDYTPLLTENAPGVVIFRSNSYIFGGTGKAGGNSPAMHRWEYIRSCCLGVPFAAKKERQTGKTGLMECPTTKKPLASTTLKQIIRWPSSRVT